MILLHYAAAHHLTQGGHAIRSGKTVLLSLQICAPMHIYDHNVVQTDRQSYENHPVINKHMCTFSDTILLLFQVLPHHKSGYSTCRRKSSIDVILCIAVSIYKKWSLI